VNRRKSILDAFMKNKSVKFLDPSGHVVQEIEFKVSWGDNGKKNK
jgi:hypothetical protein